MRRILPLLLVLLCLMTGRALAADPLTFTVSCPSLRPEQINDRMSGSSHVLFLPGVWDAAAIRVDFAGEAVYFGDVRVAPGETVDLTCLLGQKQPLRNEAGHRLGDVTVCQGSAIPAMFLTVDAAQLPKIAKSKQNRIESGEVVYLSETGEAEYDGALAALRCRGNTTFSYKKKPYQLKLAKKADLSGMGKSKTWLLLANFSDVSLLHNQIALDLAREIGIPFAVDCRPVDLYINGNYAGLYLLTEKVQAGNNRVEIDDLEARTQDVNDLPLAEAPAFTDKQPGLPVMRGCDIPADPEDITGGYLIEMEKSFRFRDSKAPGFKTGIGLTFNIKAPEYPSHAQVAYIGGLMDDFIGAAYASDGISPDSGRYYADFIDMDSFALKYLLENFTKNYDFRGNSQFFFKDSDAVDSKLYAGPVWDYDLIFGALNWGAEGDYLSENASKGNLWWMLYKHDDFRARVIALYWERLRPACLTLLGDTAPTAGSAMHSLDDYAAQIEGSAAMNYLRWNVADSIALTQGGSGRSFSNGVEVIRSFVRKRLAFFDGYWPQP